MASLTYYSSIPQSTDVIANSQPQILTNFASIGSWTGIDHYAFGTAKDGWHKTVTYPLPVTQLAQTGSACTIYSQAGVAFPTVSDVALKNPTGLFPMSCLRACGNFTQLNGNGPITLNNGFNVDSITASGGGITNTVVLTSTVTTGNHPIVLITGNNFRFYSFSSNTLVITLSSTGSTNDINFAIYQV